MRSKLALRVALTHLCTLSLSFSRLLVFTHIENAPSILCAKTTQLPSDECRLGPKQAGWMEGKQHVWQVTCIHFSVKENRSNLFVRRSLIFRRPSLAWSFGKSACDTFSCLCVTLSVVACLQVEYFLCVVANKLNKNLHFFHTCVKVQKCLLVVYVVHSPGLKAPMLMSKEKKT